MERANYPLFTFKELWVSYTVCLFHATFTQVRYRIFHYLLIIKAKPKGKKTGRAEMNETIIGAYYITAPLAGSGMPGLSQR